MLIWSLGIPYFQLPLSGSQLPAFHSICILFLSTPSLGITKGEKYCARCEYVFKPTWPLSTPSLGITRIPYPSVKQVDVVFQLPLSGSRVGETNRVARLGILAFNSLSRDHTR